MEICRCLYTITNADDMSDEALAVALYDNGLMPALPARQRLRPPPQKEPTKLLSWLKSCRLPLSRRSNIQDFSLPTQCDTVNMRSVSSISILDYS